MRRRGFIRFMGAPRRATADFNLARYVSGGSTTQNNVPLGWYLFGCLGKHYMRAAVRRGYVQDHVLRNPSPLVLNQHFVALLVHA
jgi:hypothetical protein